MPLLRLASMTTPFIAAKSELERGALRISRRGRRVTDTHSCDLSHIPCQRQSAILKMKINFNIAFSSRFT